MDTFHVLLVDDLESNLLLLEEMLTAPELTLKRSRTGAEAVACAHDSEFTLILLDVELSDMAGFEVARRIKAEGASRAASIIFISAHSDKPDYELQGYEAGAVDFLFKPLRPGQIRSKVRYFCEVQRREALSRRHMEDMERQKQALEQEIAERTRVEEAHQESEVRYRSLVELSPVAIVVEVEGKMQYINTAVLKLLGARERDDVLGRSILEYVHPECREAVDQHLQQVAGQGGQFDAIEERFVRGDGEVVDVELGGACVLYEGDIGVQLAIQDITVRKRLERELRMLSQRDGLTGIANRRAFDETLAREVRRAKRSKQSLAVILIDIDSFKKFNDNYGHPAGDHCLSRVASAMESVLKRASDMVARYGGEEFAVILPETDLQGAVRVAEELRAAVSALAIPHAFSAAADHVTLSLGVTMFDHEGAPTAEALIASADKGLYEAKHAGRNRVCIWPPDEAAARQ